MTIPQDLASLTALFTKLGAREPAEWAKSQVNEGIPQLQRFLFLRQAWENVVDENDESWIEKQIQQSDAAPSGPYSGVGVALKSCLDKGVTSQDILDIVRGAQAELLFQICYLLDDPGIDLPELKDFSWSLFQTDDDGNPVGPPIEGLHEDVLATDPSGREMRPRGAQDV